MATIRRLKIEPPLLNSACPWASSQLDLDALFKCQFTGAVTTRTATARGFSEDPAVHQVAFSQRTGSSINSYGYSPYALSTYITWVQALIQDNPTSTKPIIISITSSDPSELSEMVTRLQDLRKTLSDNDPNSTHSRVAIELNTSCPNIPNAPPPAYDIPRLKPLLDVLAEEVFKDKTLVVGLKLAPFVYRKQQLDVVDLVSSYTNEEGFNPFAFFTCTNTLGNTVMFRETPAADASLALPNGFGGLGGESIHFLALGNVLGFKQILAEHSDTGVHAIGIIGVGGVASPEAFGRMKAAGATAVACATALGKGGVSVFERLLG